MRPFYITTPIYYVNDRPHIGTAYSTIAADVLARYHRLRGRPTRFLTGLDEHGQKIERRAKEQGKTPQQFVDEMASPFEQMWKTLNCLHDDFIRTTEPRHERRVHEMWRRAQSSGDIYLGEYEGWYCVADETFYTEKELVDGKAPSGRPVERVREKSYFFKLSAYTDRLLAFYEENPQFVRPEGRFNEVKAFVREGLKDLSISRTTFKWGVPVPGDPEHVIYVWFDALTNYLSSLGGPPAEGERAPLFDRFWPPAGDAVHLVGKDILRFHAVYWPAFLMSAGLKPPTQVWAHGWLTVNGEKMSKSSGNFLSPEPLVEVFGADVLRYYLMRDIVLGQDGDFSHANLLARYHGDLGNGLGNLLNRMVASIVKKSFDGKVPTPDRPEDVDRELMATAKRISAQVSKHLENIAPSRALDALWELVVATNKYVDTTAPWNLAKDPAQATRLGHVVYTTLEALRWIGTMLWPFMPSKSDALRAQLGVRPVSVMENADQWPQDWGGLEPARATAPGAPLFPRFDKDQEKAVMTRLTARQNEVSAQAPTAASSASAPAAAAPPAAPAPAPADGTKATITIDDLVKVDLRLALVLEAERVPKSEKLLKLQVDAGDGAPRQILAGIGQHYAPEALVGKRVVVVANLAPRKMMGLESRGMVLAASDEKGLSVLFVDKELTPGSEVR